MSSGVPRQLAQQKFTNTVQEIICLIFKDDESFTLDFYPMTQYHISLHSIFYQNQAKHSHLSLKELF